MVEAASGNLISAHPMPLKSKTKLSNNEKPLVDGEAIHRLLRPFAPRIVWAIIEEVSAAPEQGVVSMFRFGEGYGVAQGIVNSFYIRLVKMRPATWKGDMNLSRNKADSLAKANQLWPEHAQIWSKKKNDGLAEAALMAWHGRKFYTYDAGDDAAINDIL